MHDAETTPEDLALLTAVEAGKLAAARAALGDGASPDALRVVSEDHGCQSSTPALYTACQSGNEPMTRLLLSAGANPNAIWKRRGMLDFEERPCLIAAFEHPEIVRLLLESGADPNQPSLWGEDCSNYTSPLSHARGKPELECLLKRYGAR